MKHHDQITLQVGLIVNSLTLPNWVYTMLGTLMNSEFAELKILLQIQSSNKLPDFTGCSTTQESLCFRVYQKIEDFLFTPIPTALAKKDATSLLVDIPMIRINPDFKLNPANLSHEQINKVKLYDLDVLIDLSTINLRQLLAPTTRYGLWSFVHSDTNNFIGNPTGFWEVFEMHPVTGSVLQVTRSDDKHPFAIARAYSATHHLSLNKNRNTILWKSASLLPKRLEALAKLGAENFFNAFLDINPKINRKQKLKTSPSNYSFPLLCLRHASNYLRYRIYHSRYMEQWVLMFKRNDHLLTNVSDYNLMAPPIDRFWADPFVVWKDSKYYIFIEEIFYNNHKGHISVIEMDEEGTYSKAIKILETNFHLSYPYVFQWENQWYMIPETNNNGTIESYICDSFPYKWKFHKTLMKGLSAVDSTLIQHKGKWWLFANLKQQEGESNCDNLYIFYADSPLSDNWTEHALNPVVTDVRRSRPAGRIFHYNGHLVRPSQDSSYEYGFGIHLNRIVELTETLYKEEEFESIMPDKGNRITGAHTFAYVNKLNLIDAKLKVRRKGSLKHGHYKEY